MFFKIKKILDLLLNMGFRYVFFRLTYLLRSNFSLQKIKFPTNPKFRNYISVDKWKENMPIFFFKGKKIHGLPKRPNEELKNSFNEIYSGVFTFFNALKINLGTNYDWVTNPITKYKYDINKHWSEINDFSNDAGDIKYVWEKARFSFLYEIIRYDYHFQDDQSKFVFQQIEDFIIKNPINKGPNYKCSQEISLRILNWTFALYYYKDSQHLTEPFFDKFMHSVYWQLHHVYHNINFSRISVRNNHAITECLILYLSEKLFPFFPNVKKWSMKGKLWFEKEIEYQIYPDGSFLQFSMNYHRVLIQLLTWGIQLAKLNKETFKQVVYERSEKSLDFLKTCIDPVSGNLPNYGCNDGALFFKLNNDKFGNFRSQIDDLSAVLKGYSEYNSKSSLWYGVTPTERKPVKIPLLSEFKESGYYIMQEENTKTFIRCGSYKDRPYQSDNLHLDLWVDGKNILRDSGSYMYNTKKELINYFNGCEGHNTISIDGMDQMQKGDRFIWYFWVKKAEASLINFKNKLIFSGKINAFRQLSSNITHTREVSKIKGSEEWLVKDMIEGVENKIFYQYWHFSKEIINKLSIVSRDKNNKILEPNFEEKWYSSSYGIKEKSIRLSFSSDTNLFKTKIIYKK